MNERGANLLVQAALKGVPQGKYALKSDDGLCAIGVLAQDYLDRHGLTWKEAGRLCEGCGYHTKPHYHGLKSDHAMQLTREYGGVHGVAEANNAGMDFLTIARKFEQVE